MGLSWWNAEPWTVDTDGGIRIRRVEKAVCVALVQSRNWERIMDTVEKIQETKSRRAIDKGFGARRHERSFALIQPSNV